MRVITALTKPSLCIAIALAATLLAMGSRLSPAQAADVIDEWASVKPPPPPASAGDGRSENHRAL